MFPQPRLHDESSPPQSTRVPSFKMAAEESWFVAKYLNQQDWQEEMDTSDQDDGLLKTLFKESFQGNW